MAKTIVGLFDRGMQAQDAIRRLVGEGFPRANISLVVKGTHDDTAATPGDTGDVTMAAPGDAGAETYESNPEYQTIEPDSAEGAATGAESGALIGGLAGLLLGIGTFAIPGVGFVVATGTLATVLTSTFAGASVGAVAGGLVGALVGVGVPSHHAHHYQEAVRRGSALVILHADDERAPLAAEIMRENGAVDIDRRAEEHAASGFVGPNGEEHAAASFVGPNGEERATASFIGTAPDRLGATVSTAVPRRAEAEPFETTLKAPTDGTTASTSDRSYAEPPTLLGSPAAPPAHMGGGREPTRENPAIGAATPGATSNLNEPSGVTASLTGGPTVSGASVDNPLAADEIFGDTNAGTRTPPRGDYTAGVQNRDGSFDTSAQDRENLDLEEAETREETGAGSGI
jgi:uncharacterized membrane protein